MDVSMYQKDVFNSYSSNSQIARVLTENWFSNQMYCPCCLSKSVSTYEHNKKGYDFHCLNCGNDFQLKSSKKPIGRKVVDGEYYTMKKIIDEGKSPNFFIMHYSSDDWRVKSLNMIPKFFVTHSMIEKRKPLSQNARRAGWTGCNFLMDKLPQDGKINIIKNEEYIEKEKVHSQWRKMFFLANKKPEFRGWTSDVLKVVEDLGEEFTLNEIYKYEKYFKELHPLNNNIQAKIRQQLQILRDNKILEFKERGMYKVVK